MSIGKPSQPRGSRSINPGNFIIAAEGLDELAYLSALKLLIPKRYSSYYRILLVTRDVHHSSIAQSFESLVTFIDKHHQGLLKGAQINKYLIFDFDKNFSTNHAANTWSIITQSRQHGIKLICSKPCFEIWLILHFLNILTVSPEELQLISDNRANYIKQKLHQVRNSREISDIVKDYKLALENSRLACAPLMIEQIQIPPASVLTNFGLLIEDLQASGILE